MANFQVTEVQKALNGAGYPMGGPQLADLAATNGADRSLVAACEACARSRGRTAS